MSRQATPLRCVLRSMLSAAAVDLELSIGAWSALADPDTAAGRAMQGDADDGADFVLKDSNDDLDLRLARLEHLVERRPELLSSVVLRQNPHNVSSAGGAPDAAGREALQRTFAIDQCAVSMHAGRDLLPICLGEDLAPEVPAPDILAFFAPANRWANGISAPSSSRPTPPSKFCATRRP